MILIDVKTKLFTARGHARVMRDVLRQRMEFFRDELLPTHFEVNELTRPGGGYNYEARTRATQLRKAKKFGHQKPLVQTGRLFQAVMVNSQITATQHRSRFKSHGYFPMNVLRRREIEAITPGQQKLLRSGLRDLYVRAAQLPENQDVLRQRIRR